MSENGTEMVSEGQLISNELRQQLIELFPNPAFIVDNGGVCFTSNSATSLFLGYEQEEFVNKNVSDFVCSDEKKIFDFKQLQQQNKSANQEWEFTRKDGTKVWGEVYSRKLPSGYWGVVINDVTEIKHANEKLLKEKIFADGVINSLPGVFYLFTQEGKYLRWNNNLAKISGYSDEEISQMHPLDLCPDNEKQEIGEKIKEALVKGEVFVEGHLLCKDRSEIPYIFTGKKIEIDNISCVAGMGIDISKSKQAENESYKLAAIVESSDDAIISKDFDGTILSWNNGASRIFGYSSEEIVGKSISILFPPDLIEEEIEIINKIKLGEHTKNYETIRVRKDGTHFPISLTVSPIRNLKGKIIGVSKICQDITNRKEAENEAYKLASIVESSADGIISADLTGRIQSWNRGASRIFGYTSEEIIGKNASILFPPDLLHELPEVIDRLITEKDFTFETIRVKKDGTHFPASITTSLIKNIRGKTDGLSIICRDITVEKQTAQAYIESEEQLRQSQKVEAVGRLAGGIAHDFNNFLAVIMLHIDMLNLQLPADSSLRYRVSEIKTVTENAAGMVKQLLAFGRKQTLQPHPIVLNQVVKQFMEVLRPLVGEDIDIQLDLHPDLGVCFVDPNQVSQVLMNLAVNARDAMPKGGKLRIRTENIQLNKGDFRKRKPQPTGAYIQLTVTDTGTGMDQQTQKRIFEPFFTTKEAGKGTGLGLATVYGIIKQSNGFIWVESEQNHGTTFKIQFPRVDQPSTVVKSESISTFPSGTETILLVEDEEQVRRAAIEVLTVLGYQVFEAGNGSQAIQLAKLYKETIHLLLTDVVMPKMNGKEMAEQIKLIHPESTVLFMSGYNDDIIANHGILDEKLHFLGKPFSPSTLANKVREVLDLDDKTE